MICVFFRQPVFLGVQKTFTPVESRAASAAAEITNTVTWLIVYS